MCIIDRKWRAVEDLEDIAQVPPLPCSPVSGGCQWSYSDIVIKQFMYFIDSLIDSCTYISAINYKYAHLMNTYSSFTIICISLDISGHRSGVGSFYT